MKYSRPNPRPCDLRYAQSGISPDWAIVNAKEAVRLAQTVGIEPMYVFPGTRQIGMRLYHPCTEYQISLLANAIVQSKLSTITTRVWKVEESYIYIDYSEGISEEKALKVPDFEVGTKLRNRVSKRVVEVFAVDDTSFTIGIHPECASRYPKLEVKRMYKLIKTK